MHIRCAFKNTSLNLSGVTVTYLEVVSFLKTKLYK